MKNQSFKIKEISIHWDEPSKENLRECNYIGYKRLKPNNGPVTFDKIPFHIHPGRVLYVLLWFQIGNKEAAYLIDEKASFNEVNEVTVDTNGFFEIDNFIVI